MDRQIRFSLEDVVFDDECPSWRSKFEGEHGRKWPKKIAHKVIPADQEHFEPLA